MGLLVILLSLTNIALGYGLAVYLRRSSTPATYPCTPAPRPEPVPTEEPKVVVTELPPPAVAAVAAPEEVPTTTAEEVSEVLEPDPQPEPAENLASEVAEEPQPSVGEEDVLAGIEAFRAQLAQVKDDAEVEEPVAS